MKIETSKNTIKGDIIMTNLNEITNVPDKHQSSQDVVIVKQKRGNAIGPYVYEIDEIKDEIYDDIENEVLTDIQKIGLERQIVYYDKLLYKYAPMLESELLINGNKNARITLDMLRNFASNFEHKQMNE